jgi:hypothetical protein
MKLLMILGSVWTPPFANDLDAFVPEIWAQESLMILENNMVAANLVHRDFEDEIASFGDTVNTRRPAEFAGARKIDDDEVTTQDATAANVAVRLDQHIHTSFVIKDGEESKGFSVLREVYLEPAMLSIAQIIDEVVLGNVYQFLTLDDGSPNVVGQLGVAATKQSLIGVRERLNDNKCPQPGRNLILTPGSEGDLLSVDALIAADATGDDGTALREASLGRKFGINHWMAQNTPTIIGGALVAGIGVGAINLAAGYPAGTTVMTVDGYTGAVTTGAYVTIAGDMTPQRVTAHAETLGATTSITVFPGLVYPVADNAAIVTYQHALIDFVAGYAAGYTKILTVDTVGVATKVGQLATFKGGAGLKENFSSVYTVGAPTATKILVNKALDVALADNDVVGLGPDGNYNWAFHRNALTLVTRPLAAPAAGTGALSFVASFNGMSMRVTITYDGKAQGHRVTADMLLGVKVLDRRLGCVMLG